MRRSKVNKILSALMILLIVVVITIVYISIRQGIRVKRNSAAIAHTAQVMNIAVEVKLLSSGYVLAVRDYLHLKEGQFILLMKTNRDELTKRLDELAKLEAKDIQQPIAIDSLKYYVNKLVRVTAAPDSMVKLVATPVELERNGIGLRQDMRSQLDKIQVFTSSLINLEYREREEQRAAGEKSLNQLKLILFSVLGFILVLAIIIIIKIRSEFSRQLASEHKFRTLLDAAPDATIISNANGDIVMANRQAEKLLGFTIEELVGLKVEVLIPEAMRERHTAQRQGFFSSGKDRSMHSGMEMIALGKDGRNIPVEISLSPIVTDEGKFIAAAIRDITERKRAEEELRQLYAQINQATEAIYVTDDNLMIRTWNQGAEVLYGFSREEALGRYSVSLLNTQLSVEEYNTALKAMTEFDYWSGDIKRKKQNGEWVYVHTSLSAIRNSAKEVTGYLSISFDITAEKQLREEVRYLANITDQMSEAVFSSKAENRKILSWNTGAERLFGFTREESIGKTVLELGLVHLTREEFGEIGDALNKDGVWKEERVFYKKDGSAFTASVSANTFWDEQKKEQSFVFLVKDISVEKMLADALKKSNEELEERVQSRTLDLGQREKQYRYLFENNPMPMWVFDLEDFRFLDVNEMAIQKYGYSREEFLNMTLLDIRPEAEKERFQSYSHAWRMQSEETNRGVWRHCKKNGEIIDVEVFAHSILFQGKKARLILLNDVTSRLKSENELVNSEKKFRALIENSTDIIALMGKDHIIKYRSPSAIRITGWSDEEMYQKNFLSEIVHPDDRERVGDVFQQVLMSPGIPMVTYYRSLHKNGNYIDVEGVMINLLHRNYVKAVIFNLRDVTEQKRTEQRIIAREKRFRSLIENSFDIIILMNEQFQVSYRSPSAERITGRTDSEVIGTDPREFIHPDDRKSITAGIERLLKNPASSEYAIFRFVYPKGGFIWLEGYATNLLMDENVRSIVFNYRDVTARVLAEEKTRASEERYRETMDNMIEGVQIIGFDWKYKYVNNAVTGLSHYSKAELLEGSLFDLYPGFRDTEIFKALSTCFEDRLPSQIETKFVLPDGYELWLQLSIQPVPEGVFVLSLDITEKTKSTVALKEEQRKLELIAASSPGLIYSFQMKPDGSLSFPYASNALEDMFGYGHEIISNDVSGLLSSTITEDRSNFINTLQASALYLSPWNLEFRYHHPTKGLIWIEGNSIPTKEPDGTITWYGVIMDVTDRKRIQEKVNEQAAQLKTLSDNLPGVMIYQIVATSFEDMQFTYISNEVTRLTGHTPEEIIQDRSLLYNRIFEEDMKGLISAVRDSFDQFSIINIEFRLHSCNDGIRWLNLVSTPRKTELGQMVWDGFHIDITERKNSESAIRESEERYRTLVEQAFDGILFYDGKGHILDCNNSATVTMGYSREELRQMNVADLFFEKDLEARPLDIPEVTAGSQVFDFRTMRRKDGSKAEIELVTRVLPDGRHLAVGRDVSDQIKALSQQSLLSSIVNTSDDAILSTDLHDLVTSWNKGAEQVYGYTEEEMIGQKIHILLPDEIYIDELGILDRIHKGEYLQHYETKRKRKDGTLIQVSITASPLINKKEELTGMSEIVRDITRQKQDENRIRISNERYESVAKATSDAIWDFDYITGKTFIAGTGYRDLFGYPLVNVFSEPGFWEDRIHPEDKEKVMERMEWAKQDQTISQSSMEYRFRRADGSWAYLNDRFFIIRDQDGKPLRLLGAKQDITKQKEAELELKLIAVEKQLLFDRLSVILNTLPASVALLDPKGIMVEVNEAWKNFADVNGLSGVNYGVGTNYFTIYTLSFGDSEKNGKDISAGVQDVLDGKTSQFEYEYSWHLPRLKRWFRIVVTPLKGHEFNGAVVMHMDISEIRRLELERIENKIEEQKKITEAMLKGQEKERNAIGIELHDNVNQILVGTKVLLSVVRDFPDKSMELVPSCIDNISLAIQENRKIAHELVTPNLSDENLLQQITRLSQTMLQNAGIKTYINHESLHENLLTNEMKLALYRVAQEQCTNIIKYAGAAQVIISLATKRDYFIMRIADDGHGTDPGKVTHGIGLKNISSRLGVFSGTISIDTAPEQGFALEIEIPLLAEKVTGSAIE